MKTRLSVGLVALLSVVVVFARGAAPLRVGILPFDVVGVDGADESASTALAKVVRIEMIKGQKVTPVLLTLPVGATKPVAAEQAATIGQAAKVDVVVVGTVLEASVTQSSRSANTGGLLSAAGIGAQIDRATAHVSLHVDLVDPAASKIVTSFDVDGKASETGVGMDFSTALGGMDSGGGAEKTPMGKALSDVAHKVNDEIVKRASKFAH